MKGIGTFVLLVLVVVAAAMVLGMCCIGTFFAPDLWMKIVCFVITNMSVVGITVFASAVAMAAKEQK